MSSNTITLTSHEGLLSTTIDASQYLQSTVFYLPDGQTVHSEQILPVLENTQTHIPSNKNLEPHIEIENNLCLNSIENIKNDLFADSKEDRQEDKQNEQVSLFQELEQIPILYQESTQENINNLQSTQLFLINQEKEEILQPIFYLNYTLDESNLFQEQEMESLLNDPELSDLLKVKPRSQDKYIRRTEQIGESLSHEQKLELLDSYINKGQEPSEISQPSKEIKNNEKLIEVINNNIEETSFYKCDLCDSKFSKEKQYFGHMHLHTNDRQFICQICLPNKEHFKSEFELRQHEKIIHGPLKSYRTHQCDKCDESFIRLSQLNYHQRRNHQNEKKFSCQVCKKKFFKKSDLKTHLITHLGLNKAICEICGRKFNHISNYIRHSRKHKGIKPYFCRDCGSRFYQSTHLNIHKCISRNISQKNKSFKKIQLFPCPYCKKKYKFLRSHIKMVHSNESLSTNDELDNKKNNVRKYYCYVCGETFQFNCQLKSHEYENHNEGDIKCSSCNKIYLNLKEFKFHECFLESSKESQDKKTNNLIEGENHIFFENNNQMENLEENNQNVINRKLDSTTLDNDIPNEKNQQITETTKSLAKFIQDFEYFPLLESSESNQLPEFNSQEKLNYPDDFVIVVSQNNENNQQMSLKQFIPPKQDSLEFNTNVNYPTSFNHQDIITKEEEEYDSSNSLDPLDFLFPRQESHSPSHRLNNKQNFNLSIKSHTQISSEKIPIITSSSLSTTLPSEDIQINSQNKFFLTEKSIIKTDFPSKEIITSLSPSKEQTSSILNTTNCKTISPILFKKKEYSCSECPKVFSKKINLQQHLGTHFEGMMKYQCNICQNRFAWWTTYQKHLNLCPGQPMSARPQLLSCQFCDKKYKTKVEVRKHEKIEHQYLPHACTYCPKRFFKLCDLNYHIRLHTKEKPYLCPFCGKGFNHVSHVKRHERVHTGEKPYQCEICGQRFSQTNTFHSHKKIHCDNRSKDLLKKNKTQLNTENSFNQSCPKCNKSFKKEKLFNLHTEQCNYIPGSRFLCEICNATFAWKNCLFRHLRVQHKIIFEKPINNKRSVPKKTSHSNQPAQPIEDFLYDSLQYYLSFNVQDK